MKARRAIFAGAGVFVVLLAASLVVLQDAFVRALLDPRTPFQVTPAPPAPDYGARNSWLLWPEPAGPAGAADIFYVHSTTYYSSESWNAPIDDEGAAAVLVRAALPNEAGPFLGAGRVFAPRYRQATLFSFFTHKYDGVAPRQAAYEDVKRAFEAFLAASGDERPIVLVGYEQGGLHVLGLLKDFFQTDELMRRLAAAYVIGQPAPLSLFEGSLAKTPPCGAPAAPRCVVSYSDFERRFDEEMRRLRERSMVWTDANDLVATKGAELLCVNPLTGAPTDAYIGPERHLGAASATGLPFGDAPPPVKETVGAQCIDGILVVDRPREDFLRRGAWFGAKWRTPEFNLFYFDLAADAARRIETVALLLEEEAKYLAPIEESVDVEVSPINKVPKP